ncbi:MAG: glycoside hydrolase family 38 N-terminal domain-containing protein [Victivallaceae bacterium]
MKKLSIAPTKRQQVIEEIKKCIKLGDLEPGDRLATVRNMSNHFGTSISVIQSALRELVSDGMIECCGASGFFVKGAAEAVADPEKSPGQFLEADDGKTILTAHHHSDLTWNKTYDEYAVIREAQINLLLGYIEKYPQFNFFLDQSEVVRMYLQKNPDKLETLRKYVKSGNIEMFGEFCIPDLNLCSGESLVRNLLAGRRYFKENFGITPDIASMNDSFGMNAQLPQMLDKAGYRYLFGGRLPGVPKELIDKKTFVWKGLDGSDIIVTSATRFIDHGSYTINVPVTVPHAIRLAQTISSVKHIKGDVLAVYMTEEELLQEDFLWILDSVNRQGGRPIEFGKVSDFTVRISPETLSTFTGEINPVFSGCYTTRIGVKQNIRKAENLLFTAEAISAISGTKDDYEPSWHELFLTQFHDAAAGCHTDKVNSVINGKLNFITVNCEEKIQAAMKHLSGGGLTIFNPNIIAEKQIICYENKSGLVPDGISCQADGGNVYFEAGLQPLGITGFKLKKAAPAKEKTVLAPETFSLKTDYYEAIFTDGKAHLKSRNTKKNVFGENFGEIVFRRENGSLWSERILSPICGSESQNERIVEVAEGEIFFKVVTEGSVTPGKTPVMGNLGDYWPGFEKLSFRKEYFFPKHQDYFKLKLILNWKGNDTKIQIRFPVELNPKFSNATYEIPFGSIIRKPYFEVPYEYEDTALALNSADYQHAAGDWPALNWVNYSDTTAALSVANTGTPGHQLVGKNIFVSLIRSGTRCEDGMMTPQFGSFDNGIHEYEFAFCAHQPDGIGKAVRLGQLLNRKPVIHVSTAEKIPAKPLSLLKYDAENILLSAVYKDGDSIIVRLYETLGRAVKTQLHGKFKVYETDFALSNECECSNNELYFKPHEIKTLKLKVIK